jgi:tRNA-(ms[2]io[6]A)-hydroxylase
MLIDHANCELKAASTALGFLYRYPDRAALVQRMSRLAREELRHFEQVRSIMDNMDIPFERLTASRYAGSLREAVRHEEPYKLLDLLLIGALIEARSCERFAKIAPRKPGTSSTTSRLRNQNVMWMRPKSTCASQNSRYSKRR